MDNKQGQRLDVPESKIDIINMARIFITGSSDGLGLLAAQALIDQGHRVVLHTRTAKRKDDTLTKIKGAEAILTGDLSSMEETIGLTEKVNRLGSFDAIIHNAGVYNTSGEQILKVNVLAPYILTCLIQKPKRLVYVSSSMHLGGKPKLDCFKTNIERINYSDSKLHLLLLCKFVARQWTDVYVNGINPGWVPTKMGGSSATDDLQKGYETQVWLATSNDNEAKVSGQYFFHQKIARSHPDADNLSLQEEFMSLCREITGISFPDNMVEAG